MPGDSPIAAMFVMCALGVSALPGAALIMIPWISRCIVSNEKLPKIKCCLAIVRQKACKACPSWSGPDYKNIGVRDVDMPAIAVVQMDYGHLLKRWLARGPLGKEVAIP